MTTESDEQSNINKGFNLNNDNKGLMQMKSLNKDGRILTREDVGLMPLEQIQQMLEIPVDKQKIDLQNNLLNKIQSAPKSAFQTLKENNKKDINNNIQSNFKLNNGNTPKNNIQQNRSLKSSTIDTSEFSKFNTKLQNLKPNNLEVLSEVKDSQLQSEASPSLKKKDQNNENPFEEKENALNLKDENEVLDLDQINQMKNNQFNNGQDINSINVQIKQQILPQQQQNMNYPLEQGESLMSTRNSRVQSMFQTLKSPAMKNLLSDKNLIKQSDSQEINKTANQTPTMAAIKRNAIGQIETKQFLDRELKFILQRERSLWLSSQFFFNKITCGKAFNTEEVKLLNKAEELVRQDLDVYNILDKLKELEKLKTLLFSSEQQTLFNFFPKPVISIEKQTDIIDRKTLVDEKETIKENSFNRRNTKKLNIKFKNFGLVTKAIMRLKGASKKDNLSDYQKLYNCYEKLIQEAENEQFLSFMEEDSKLNKYIIFYRKQNQLNHKLIDLLGNEMKTIFKLARMMKQKHMDKSQVNQQPYFLSKKNSISSNINNKSRKESEDKSQLEQEQIKNYNSEMFQQSEYKKEEELTNRFSQTDCIQTTSPQLLQQNPSDILITQIDENKISNKISEDIIIFEQDDTDLSSIKDQ